ncbi:MAG: hypothetical protein HPY55_04150 [Firmicutes bacterium]|nr:hypothetical protein [Bacillota bacterium]
MSRLSPDIFRGARRLVEECAGVGPNESVLIITDTMHTNLGEALLAAALEVTLESSMVVLPTYGRVHGMNPPRAIAEAMKSADVCFMPTEWSLSHCQARRDASKAGCRCLTIPHADEEIFARTIPESPFKEMKEITIAVNQALSRANEARVTSPGGTDMWVDLRGRVNVDLEHGYCRREPEYAANFAGPPCIEANIAPVEGTARGVIVVDACQSAIGLVREPVTLVVEAGRIVDVRGGADAGRLIHRIEAVGDDRIRMIAELGIGLNPKAHMRGRFIEDEAVYGTAHFGMGNNESTMAGKITVNGHFDNVFWRPTVYLDGEPIMEDGRLTMPGIPEIKGLYV